MRFKALRSLVFASALGLSGIAQAAPIVPDFGTFGDLTGATFGGTGIPTDPTAITTATLGSGQTLTLGLAATPRFNNPALGNDGAGTYQAVAGVNDGTPGSTAGLLGTTWNFSFYADISGDPDAGLDAVLLEELDLVLFYDFDPERATDDSLMGQIALSDLLLGSGLTTSQSSQNLLFGFLEGGAPGVTPPTGAVTSFGPRQGGEYSFALRDTTLNVQSAINVEVEAVPLPLPAVFLLTGLAGLAAVRRFG